MARRDHWRTFRPVTLRALIIGLSVASVALATIFMGWAAYRIASRSLEDALVELVTARSASAAHTLDATFRAIESVPLSNARFIETLPYWDLDLFPGLIRATIQDHPDIFGATIALEPEVLPPGMRAYMPYLYQLVPGSTASYGIDWVQDYRDPAKQYPGGPHAWYREGMARPDRITWTMPYDYPVVLASGQRIGVLMTTVETTIRRGGRVVGLSTSDVTLDRLTRVAAGIRLGRRGFAILVDRYGHVLSHPQPELRFGHGARLVDVQLSNAKYGALSQWAGRIFDPGKAGGAGVIRAGPDALVFRYEEQGRSLLAAASLVPSTGWRLIVVGDESELFAPLEGLRSASLGIVLLGSLGLGLLLWAVLALAFRPVQHLVRACELIASGDFRAAQRLLHQPTVLSTTYEVDRLKQAIESVTTYIAVTAELERANLALQEGERAREQIFSHVSHDLKTPIMVVQSLGDALLEGDYGPLDERPREAIALIGRNVAHLSVLVNDLLDLSRIRAGRLQLAVRQVDPAELAGILVEEIRPLAEQKRQTLTLALAPELPVVTVDEQRIAQVLTNLLSNAIKYTPEGGNITVRLRAEAASLICEVEDDGIGIAVEDLPKLFQPFSRLGDPRAQPGTGLGLSISKALVEAHGGALRVRSQLGSGSVFWFELPVRA